MNKDPRQETITSRERVLAAIETLNYRPHANARSFKTCSTCMIGLLVQSLMQPYVGNLVNAVEDLRIKLDYGLFLATSHENRESEQHMMDVHPSQYIDGQSYTFVSCNHKEPGKQLIEQVIPVVFLDRYIPGIDTDAVMSDKIKAAQRAINCILDQVCRHIICISFSQEASPAIDQVKGYRIALHEHGIPIYEEIILNVNFTVGEMVAPYLDDYIKKKGLPDGILRTTERFIVDKIRRLKKNQILVLQQVHVVGGFFDSPWNTLLDPPVTIVNQDFQREAQTAIELLVDHLQGIESPPRNVLIEAEFLTPSVQEDLY